jgi:hypothetical protein
MLLQPLTKLPCSRIIVCVQALCTPQDTAVLMEDMLKIQMGNMFCSYNPLHIYDKVFSNATLHLVFQFYDFPCSATIDANILFPMTPINSSIMFSTNNVWTHTVTISCDDVY